MPSKAKSNNSHNNSNSSNKKSDATPSDAAATAAKTSVQSATAPAGNWAAKAIKTPADTTKPSAATAKFLVTPSGTKKIEPVKEVVVEEEEVTEAADQAASKPSKKKKAAPQMPSADAFAISLGDISGGGGNAPDFMVNEGWRPKRTNSNPPRTSPASTSLLVGGLLKKEKVSGENDNSTAEKDREGAGGDPEYNPHVVTDPNKILKGSTPMFEPIRELNTNNSSKFLAALKTAKKEVVPEAPAQENEGDENDAAAAEDAMASTSAPKKNSKKKKKPQDEDFPTLDLGAAPTLGAPAATTAAGGGWGAALKTKEKEEEPSPQPADESIDVVANRSSRASSKAVSMSVSPALSAQKARTTTATPPPTVEDFPTLGAPAAAETAVLPSSAPVAKWGAAATATGDGEATDGASATKKVTTGQKVTVAASSKQQREREEREKKEAEAEKKRRELAAKNADEAAKRREAKSKREKEKETVAVEEKTVVKEAAVPVVLPDLTAAPTLGAAPQAATAAGPKWGAATASKKSSTEDDAATEKKPVTKTVVTVAAAHAKGNEAEKEETKKKAVNEKKISEEKKEKESKKADGARRKDEGIATPPPPPAVEVSPVKPKASSFPTLLGGAAATGSGGAGGWGAAAAKKKTDASEGGNEEPATKIAAAPQVVVVSNNSSSSKTKEKETPSSNNKSSSSKDGKADKKQQQGVKEEVSTAAKKNKSSSKVDKKDETAPAVVENDVTPIALNDREVFVSLEGLSAGGPPVAPTSTWGKQQQKQEPEVTVDVEEEAPQQQQEDENKNEKESAVQDSAEPSATSDAAEEEVQVDEMKKEQQEEQVEDDVDGDDETPSVPPPPVISTTKWSEEGVEDGELSLPQMSSANKEVAVEEGARKREEEKAAPEVVEEVSIGADNAEKLKTEEPVAPAPNVPAELPVVEAPTTTTTSVQQLETDDANTGKKGGKKKTANNSAQAKKEMRRQQQLEEQRREEEANKFYSYTLEEMNVIDTERCGDGQAMARHLAGLPDTVQLIESLWHRINADDASSQVGQFRRSMSQVDMSLETPLSSGGATQFPAVTSAPPRKKYFEKGQLHNQVTAILNKVAPNSEKWREVYFEVQRLPLPTANDEQLAKVINVIFTKAVEEQQFVSLYAQLFKELTTVSDGVIQTGDPAKWIETRLRNQLLSRCQQVFEKATVEARESDEAGAEEEEMDPEERAYRDEQRLSRKRKHVGNVRFVAELYLKGTVATGVIDVIVNDGFIKQPDPPTELQVEILLALLEVCGKTFSQDMNGKNPLRSTTTLNNLRQKVSRVIAMSKPAEAKKKPAWGRPAEPASPTGPTLTLKPRVRFLIMNLSDHLSAASMQPPKQALQMLRADAPPVSGGQGPPPPAYSMTPTTPTPGTPGSPGSSVFNRSGGNFDTPHTPTNSDAGSASSHPTAQNQSPNRGLCFDHPGAHGRPIGNPSDIPSKSAKLLAQTLSEELAKNSTDDTFDYVVAELTCAGASEAVQKAAPPIAQVLKAWLERALAVVRCHDVRNLVSHVFRSLVERNVISYQTALEIAQEVIVVTIAERRWEDAASPHKFWSHWAQILGEDYRFSERTTETSVLTQDLHNFTFEELLRDKDITDKVRGVYVQSVLDYNEKPDAGAWQIAVQSDEAADRFRYLPLLIKASARGELQLRVTGLIEAWGLDTRDIEAAIFLAIVGNDITSTTSTAAKQQQQPEQNPKGPRTKAVFETLRTHRQLGNAWMPMKVMGAIFASTVMPYCEHFYRQCIDLLHCCVDFPDRELRETLIMAEIIKTGEIMSAPHLRNPNLGFQLRSCLRDSSVISDTVLGSALQKYSSHPNSLYLLGPNTTVPTRYGMGDPATSTSTTDSASGAPSANTTTTNNANAPSSQSTTTTTTSENEKREKESNRSTTPSQAMTSTKAAPAASVWGKSLLSATTSTHTSPPSPTPASKAASAVRVTVTPKVSSSASNDTTSSNSKGGGGGNSSNNSKRKK